MESESNNAQDVMLVCRNGHVITDRLRSCPEQARAHCERCGASTLDRCPTCGRKLPGAVLVPGLQPVGVLPAPAYCATCGAMFPWTRQRQPPKTERLTILETLLRRLPRAIRELRVRHADRPPFRVVDEKDLEDLLRALLPLFFEDVRPENRTPRYAAGTRTDFVLAAERVAVVIKLAGPDIREQLQEDAAYHRREGKCRTLVALVYDPEASLREPRAFESACAMKEDDLDVRCVVAVP